MHSSRPEVGTTVVTSLPEGRKISRAERYFNSRQPKLSAHVAICYCCVYYDMRDKFCEFAMPTHRLYEPYKTAKTAARYLEAAPINGGGKFTKPIPHASVVRVLWLC